MSYNPNGPKTRKIYAAKKKKLFLNSALRKDGRPISLEDLEELKEDGFLPTEIFTANAGKIFPLILERISLGDSIPVIERFLGMKSNSLVIIVQRNDRLKKACNEARKINNDRAVNPPE